MRTAYWERILANGCQVPTEEPLDDLTTELVGMLGDTDPHVREALAFSVLNAWVTEGVYDNLLAGLGDGLAQGLRYRIGERETDSVFRRSYSAAMLASVVGRDNAVHALHPVNVLTWADRTISWLLAERDLRGWVPRVGWAYPVGHGADLIATLAASRHLGAEELAVLLEVIADRLVAPTADRFIDGEADRLAFATMSLLHRNLITSDTFDYWLERLTKGCGKPAKLAEQRVPAPTANTIAYLQALHLQLLLGVAGTPTQDSLDSPRTAPGLRADALLSLQQALRNLIPALGGPGR